MVEDLSDGIPASIGRGIADIRSSGWGNSRRPAAITWIGCKENVVGNSVSLWICRGCEDGQEIWGTLAGSFTAVTYSFLVFNLLCAPLLCGQAPSSGKMNNAKWTWFAIGYQTVLAIGCVSLASTTKWFMTGF